MFRARFKTIFALGMKNRNPKLYPPSSLSATFGEKEGEVDLHWDSVNGASCYAVELTRNGKKLNWQIVDVVSSSKYTVTGLRQNAAYCFRVSALDNHQQGPWSNAVTKRL